MKKHNKNSQHIYTLFCIVLSIIYIHLSYCMGNESMKVPQVDMNNIKSTDGIMIPIQLNSDAFMAALQLGDNGPEEDEDIDEWCKRWVDSVFRQIDEYVSFDDPLRKRSEERAFKAIRDKILTRRNQRNKILFPGKKRLINDDSETTKVSKIVWRYKTITAMSVGIVIIAGIAYGIWKYKNKKRETI